ncbi:MAG TPA: hypothetical protein PLZ86_02525 [bacterium]|nr:hypothetical protein [bacterium]
MKIPNNPFSRALGFLAIASLLAFSGAGCGDGGSGTSADLPADTTPASISVARHPGGKGAIISFFDEAGARLKVDKELLAEEITLEPGGVLSSLAAKDEGAASVTVVCNSEGSVCSVFASGVTACDALNLCIGDGVLPAECENDECDPLDIEGCVEISAAKGAGGLIALDGEAGCYDDFVVSSFTFVGGAVPTASVSVYAGSVSPSAVPAVSKDVEESAEIRDVGRPLFIAGNVDGGDDPKIVIGGRGFIAVPVSGEVLPDFSEDSYAAIGDIGGAADAGDVDGDGIGDLLITEIVSDHEMNFHLLPGGSLVAGARHLAEYSKTRLLPPFADLVESSRPKGGADINGLSVDSQSFSDVMALFMDDAGRSLLAVYFGRGDFDGTYDAILLGERAGDRFGYSPDLGDVDGDGYADILTTASAAGSADQGALYLFRGGENFVSRVADSAWMKVEGESPGQKLGGSVFLGDVNGDGFGDFAARSADVIGVPQVHIFFGAAKDDLRGLWSLSDAAAVTIYAEDGVSGLAGLGDIDGDGTMDFLVSTNDEILCIFLGGSLEGKIGAEKIVHVMDADLFIEDFGDVDIDLRGVAGRLMR